MFKFVNLSTWFGKAVVFQALHVVFIIFEQKSDKNIAHHNVFSVLVNLNECQVTHSIYYLVYSAISLSDIKSDKKKC